jgi:hypothetical protein
MNKGLKLFGGDAVGFLNSDDRFHDKNVLSDLALALEKAAIVFGNVEFVVDHASDHVVRRWRGSPYSIGAFSRGWMPAHPSFYVRRLVASAVGPFHLNYSIAADYEWMLRAFLADEFRSVFLDRSIVRMKTGGTSTSGVGAWIKGNLESLEARRRYLGSGLIDIALVAKPLRKMAQFAVPYALR